MKVNRKTKEYLPVAMYVLVLSLTACSGSPIPYGKTVEIDRATLEDKVKGGWFAQTIGCTYGGPTEFCYKQTVIDDSIEISWEENCIDSIFSNRPGLYDDVYMDLSFLEVMAEQGVDAPATAFAERFANAPFFLWHANQTGRNNILDGLEPPASGFWMNNPHADDIDFQIESDFIGMICPGRPDKAAEIADKIGHIMNYGDGWYGGVYMGTMYSLAYVCDDIGTVVKEGLKAIPENTRFRQTVQFTIDAYEQNPEDWKSCWKAVDDQFGALDFCPDGACDPFNIDAGINAAYVVTGLLYGGGDFARTMEISTRCGQDSDCNPATAIGILGVMKGYSAIPEEYRKEADKIQDKNFPFTSLSLNTATSKTMDLIGATEAGLRFKVVEPAPVRYEKSFDGLKLLRRVSIDKSFKDSLTIEFDGNSVFVQGSVAELDPNVPEKEKYVAELQAWLDGDMVEEIRMPNDYVKRKNELFFKYCFDGGHHILKLVHVNPDPAFEVYAEYYVTYDAVPTSNLNTICTDPN